MSFLDAISTGECIYLKGIEYKTSGVPFLKITSPSVAVEPAQTSY